MQKGPYDAAVTVLNFGTPSVDTYARCYKENLKPLFNQ